MYIAKLTKNLHVVFCAAEKNNQILLQSTEVQLGLISDYAAGLEDVNTIINLSNGRRLRSIV